MSCGTSCILIIFSHPSTVHLEYFHPPSPVHLELSLTPCLVDFYLGSGRPPPYTYKWNSPNGTDLIISDNLSGGINYRFKFWPWHCRCFWRVLLPCHCCPGLATFLCYQEERSFAENHGLRYAGAWHNQPGPKTEGWSSSHDWSCWRCSTHSKFGSLNAVHSEIIVLNSEIENKKKKNCIDW